MDYYAIAEKMLREGRKTKAFEEYKKTDEYKLRLENTAEYVKKTFESKRNTRIKELAESKLLPDLNDVVKNAAETTNGFVKDDAALTAAGKTPVSWNFPTMPSEDWKNTLGTALTAYAADPTDANWDAVEKAFVDNWKAEASK